MYTAQPRGGGKGGGARAPGGGKAAPARHGPRVPFSMGGQSGMNDPSRMPRFLGSGMPQPVAGPPGPAAAPWVHQSGPVSIRRIFGQ